MNGKYMGWREQRWVTRDPERLKKMKERRERKEKQLAARDRKGEHRDN